MERNLIIENPLTETADSLPNQDPKTALLDRLSALELQLKIYRQAEVIGEIGNWQINLNTFETWYSENTFRIYGVEPFSIQSHPNTFSNFIVEEDRKIVLDFFEKSYVEKIPIHLEFRIRRKDGEERHLCIVSSVTKNAKGEPLLTGITQDITDRKKLEIQLRSHAEKIKLQDESFMHAEQIGLFGTWEMNLNTRQTRYSDNFFRILGLKPTTLYPGLEEFSGFIHHDDRPAYKELVKRIFAGEVPAEADMRIARNDEKARYVRMRCKLVKNVDGDPVVLGVLKDITAPTTLQLQLKQMNEQLQVQNETLRQAERTINIASWTWNLNTNRVSVSDNLYVILGIKPQSIEASFETFEKYIHPMDRSIVERFNLEMKREPAEKQIEHRIIRSDGKTRYLRIGCHPIISASGHQLIIGTTQDITEDVMRRRQLKDRIRFTEMLSENIVDKVCITSSSNIIVSLNNKFESAFRLNREEVLGRNFFEVLPRMKNAETIERFKKVLAGEPIYIPNIQMEYLEGFYELTMLPIREEDDEVSSLLMILHDITEHQKLKIELEERLDFIERLVEFSAHSVMVLNRNLDFVYWNKKAEEHYHYAKENVLGKNLAEMFPGYRKIESFAKMKDAWDGEIIHVPANRAIKNSTYFETFYIPIKNSLQQVIALLWMEHDLTDLIRAEKKLQESRDLLKSVFDAAMTGVAVFESIRNNMGEIIDFEITMMNEYGSALLGGNLIGKKQLDILPEQNDGGFFKMIKEVVETGIPVDTEKYYEWPNLTGWLHITAAKMGDGLVMGFDNISERKHSEAQQMKQRSILTHTEEIAKRGSWELNMETNILTWSDQVFRMYNYAPQSFVPTVDFYINSSDPGDREKIEIAFRNAKYGEKFSITHRLLTPDGRRLHVLLSGHPVVDQSGTVSSIAGTIEDITQHRELE